MALRAKEVLEFCSVQKRRGGSETQRSLRRDCTSLLVNPAGYENKINPKSSKAVKPQKWMSSPSPPFAS